MHRKPTYEELAQEVEKLKDKTNTLSNIIESTPHGIASIDNSDRYIHINAYFTKLTGYTLEDIPNKKIWFEKAYPDANYKKQIVQIWENDIKKFGMEIIREFKIQCKNGQSKQIEFRSTFSKDQTITVLTDVTHHKKVQNALKESEERLKAIFRANPDPVAVYNAKGYPIHLNDAFIKTFGWTLKDLQGKRIPFVPKGHEKLALDKIKEIYTTGHSVRFETKRLSKQGEIFDIFLSAAIFKDAKGINNGLVVNLKNISDRKKLETQLQHAQKIEAIGTLAGGIAHDFNNILFPIMANTEILLMDIAESNPIHDKLQKIYKGAIRARDLVKQILVFSRQDSIEFRIIMLQPVIKKALSSIRSTMPSKIEIQQYISKSCGPVKADSTQIHQIVMNLAANASHAMKKKGGQMKLSLKEKIFDGHEWIDPDMKHGSYVCLSISDTGKGMDKQLIKQIFDPFFTTKEKGRGTGMGLAIVHGIVKKMNGFIKVSSKPGKGSTFIIYFPLTKI